MIGKKPLGIMIAVGKGPPPPKFKSGGDEPPQPSQERPPSHMQAPSQDDGGDYGAKLISDIEEVGQKHGIDPPMMKSIAADLFDAVATCLRGKDEQEGSAEMDSEQGQY